MRLFVVLYQKECCALGILCFLAFRAQILAKKVDRGLDMYARFGGRDFRHDRIEFGWTLAIDME